MWHDGAEVDSLRWTLGAVGLDKTRIFVLTVARAVHALVGVAYALALREIVDAAVTMSAEGTWRGVSLAVLIAAVQLVLRAIARWLGELTRTSVENRLKGRLFTSLMTGDCGRVGATHSAEWMSRLTEDTRVVAEGCADIVPGLAEMFAKLMGAIVALALISKRLVVVVLSMGAVLALATLVFRRSLRRRQLTVREADDVLRVFMQECLAALLTVRAFGAEYSAAEGARGLMGAHGQARMHANRLSNLCNMGFGFALSAMSILGVVFCAGGMLSGALTAGALTAAVQLITQIRAPLANISGYMPRAAAVLASAERLMGADDFGQDHIEAREMGEAAALYDERLASVGLESVSYSYNSTEDGGLEGPLRQVLDSATFEVCKGEMVALIGESGCGKSTLLKVLMGLYAPDVGSRYLCDAEGQRELLTEEWRRLFAYVPQGNLLLSGTVRQAVSLGDPDASHDDSRLWGALHGACAESFVRALPSQLDEPLGERGSGLSEGQAQRLAIARAIFSCSPIVLLDEATSALDSDTERQVLENLRAMRDKTIVLVTHRPAALALCDRVERLEGGRVLGR